MEKNIHEKSAAGRKPAGVSSEIRKAMKFRAALVVADKMLKARLKKRISQEELARLSGTDRTTIKRMEKASHDPKLSSIEAVAKALGMETWELIDP